MKYFLIILLTSIIVSCSSDTTITVIEPEDIIIDCEWLTINGERGWGINMYITPTGVNVIRSGGIYYHKTDMFVEKYNLSGEKDIYDLSEYDIVEYKEWEEE